MLNRLNRKRRHEMSDKVKVGQLQPKGLTERDAIHVAIAPVVAQTELAPGKHIGADGSERKPHVGIVDPYLKTAVQQGDTFYLFLYPGTVTSLRHEWTHPQFKAVSSSVNPERATAELYLKMVAMKIKPYSDSEEDAFQSLLSDLREKHIHFWGTKGNNVDDLPDPKEIKKQARIYLGLPIDWEDFEFSCSC